MGPEYLSLRCLPTLTKQLDNSGVVTHRHGGQPGNLLMRMNPIAPYAKPAACHPVRCQRSGLQTVLVETRPSSVHDSQGSAVTGVTCREIIASSWSRPK